jgi:hypothetical protein
VIVGIAIVLKRSESNTTRINALKLKIAANYCIQVPLNVGDNIVKNKLVFYG